MLTEVLARTGKRLWERTVKRHSVQKLLAKLADPSNFHFEKK